MASILAVCDGVVVDVGWWQRVCREVVYSVCQRSVWVDVEKVMEVEALVSPTYAAAASRARPAERFSVVASSPPLSPCRVPLPAVFVNSRAW